MKSVLYAVAFVALTAAGTAAWSADVVPNEIMLPGTQPNEVGSLESPDRCDNCHAGYDVNPEIEPATGWRGAAMGNAGRDPVFWATLAVAEQDFDGAGDLCIRCHSAGGWYGGRSTPTDGSGLATSDDNGIDCDTCHTSTNTDNSEHLGVMNPPFIANCESDPDDSKCSTTGADGEGFYGSGMLSLWAGSDKLGPFSDAQAKHQFMQSQWHRSPDFCGTCHDVSNSAVGDLAPGNGAQPGAPHVVSSQDLHGGAPNLGGPIEEKAAFNNPPYAFGIVERTFSEYKSSPLSSTLVSAFNSLPADLKTDPATNDFNGSLEVTYKAALNAGTGGNYEDGSDRYFSCQSCHMRPYTAKGCNKAGAPVRADMPQHDHTGGNYWFAAMTRYQDAAGTLRLGGGLNDIQRLAMDLGAERATKHLSEAALLEVNSDTDTVRVTNLTGHKLITGYPEGRRMWLRIEWRDASDAVIRVDGEYGELTVDLDQDGQVDDTVETLLDLDGANTRIYEAHYAMTQEWAATLMAVNATYYGPIVLDYDRKSGQPVTTIAQLAAMAPGSYVNTFHFALNNYVSHDNRIPPYRMSYDIARKRNALPVPATQYGGNGAGSAYQHWDELALDPPANADHAHIQLLYQGTSWEYQQFLQLANNEQNAFLGQEGNAMLDAWINADVVKSTGDTITGVLAIGGDYKMVPPVVMATANWGNAGGGNNAPVANDDGTYSVYKDEVLTVAAPGVLANDSDPDNNDTITAVQDSSAGKGTAVLNADGSFSYTPDTGFTGTDSFTYHAVDNHGAESTSATVNIRVTDLPACSAIGDKGVCNGTPGCEWVGSPKSGTCQEATVCEPTGTTEVTCTGGLDEDCDGAIDCADSDCAGDPACQTVACDNDGVCDPGEDCLSCASDCAGVTGGKPANRYCCGNGVAEAPEGDGSVCGGNF